MLKTLETTGLFRENEAKRTKTQDPKVPSHHKVMFDPDSSRALLTQLLPSVSLLC